jgi:hypothetical protein
MLQFKALRIWEKEMPSSPDYKRDYKQEAKTNKARNQYKDTLARNRNRKQAIKEGKVKPHDGKDVGHKKPLSKGGSNAKSNLKVQKSSANRSFDRTSSGAIKGKG